MTEIGPRRPFNSNVMRLYVRNRNVTLTIAWLAWLLVFPIPLTGQRGDADSLDGTVLDLFANYADDATLKVIIYSHARREPLEQAHVAFYSTWFLDGNPRVPMTTIINTQGQVFFYPLPSSEVGPTGSRWKQVADADLSTLLTTLRILPETAPLVPLPNLVIVSFRLDGRWQTRLYDRTKAPAELVTIYRFAQSRLDAK